MAGPNPTWFAVGDFDRDGHADLAAVNGTPASLGLHRGTGDGTFEPPTTLLSCGTLGAVHVSDLDHDGDLDLVLPSGADVAVLLGCGDGSFTQANVPAGGAASDIALGDLNGDGHTDLAAALATGVSISIGNGDGTFGAFAMHPGGASSTIHIVDWDLDGFQDLAFISTGIALMKGHGDGTFASKLTLGADFGGSRGLACLGPDAQGRVVLATLGIFAQEAAEVFTLRGKEANDPVVRLEETGRLLIDTQTFLHWTATDDVGVSSIDLLLSKNGYAGPFLPIVRGTPNTGSYQWIPREQVAEAVLRVVARDSAGNVGTDASDHPFVIDSVSTLATLERIGELALSRPVPAPSHTGVWFDFEIPHRQPVRLTVVDVQGRALATLEDRVLEAGRYRKSWGEAARAGIYFLRLDTRYGSRTRKILLLR